MKVVLSGPLMELPTGRVPARSIRADDPGAPNTTGSWAGVFLTARAGTIYAGSSEVQRNILGENVLGLPKEVRVDRLQLAQQRA